jgi:hypothetical protein
MDCAGLTGVVRIMGRAGGNAGEEEGSVYQPRLQSGLSGPQANETDASSVATNATTSVEDSENPGLGGRGRGCRRGRVAGCDLGRVRVPPPDITGRKVIFPADVALWPDYARLLE